MCVCGGGQLNGFFNEFEFALTPHSAGKTTLDRRLLQNSTVSSLK